MTYYLFRRKGSKIVHAVQSCRIFGGGMWIVCGQPAVGSGVLSEIPKRSGYVSCKTCRRVLKIKAKVREWRPILVRRMAGSSCLQGEEPPW